MLRFASATAAVALTAVAVALDVAPSAHAETPCTRYAAPTGSDSADGSIATPFRSVQRLADSLQPGEAGCLRAGAYSGSVKVTDPGITLRGIPGERATVIGRFWIDEGADGVTVEGLYLNGRNADGLPSPTVNANGAIFRRNDVTNNHTAICFNLGHDEYGEANGTLIERNRIHHCGVLPAANHDHGIYVARAANTVIRGNWIYENADRGIQLYPNAQQTTISGNVVDSNGQGIIFGGLEQDSSDDTRVEGNVITNSKLRYNVESHYDDETPPGQNNLVTRNCIAGGERDDGNGGIDTPTTGFTASANTRAVPTFNNPAAGDYRLAASSPCRSLVAEPDSVPGPDGIVVPGAQISRARPHGPALVLRVPARKVGRHARVPLRGFMRREARPGLKVKLMIKTRRGNWRRLAQARVGADGRFKARARLRVRRGRPAVRLLARVDGVGRSHSARLRIRSPRR
jgi:parallel beta-helix repeat protein